MPSSYEIVTSTILDALEKGVVPWRKPWAAHGSMPLSMTTKKRYTGSNVFMLLAQSMVHDYSSPYWGTYKSINKLGGKVIKGEHGTPVSFFGNITKVNKETGEEETSFIHRYYLVFNKDQTEGLEEKFPAEELPNGVSPNEKADAIASSYLEREDVPLEFRGAKAYYDPTKDRIVLPPMETFYDTTGFYETLFHECVHSTGADKRLKRDLSGMFGDHSYSFEELVAELGQAFLTFGIGMDYNVENTAAYIKSWLGVLEHNKAWIIQAGSKAEKAATFILGE